MKHQLLFLSLLFGCGSILTSCQKNEDSPTYTREGYIIGFNPCSGSYSSRGLVIAFPTSPQADTVVTYSLPNNIYAIPPEVFSNYQIDYLFPPSYRNQYKVRVTYLYTPEANRTVSMCTADINLAPYYYTVKGNEIDIKSAEAIK